MINYRKGKSRFKVNDLGSLYINNSKVSSNEQPIIYIGGQMDHRGHVIEQSGYTADLNHNLYTGSWMYEYPNNTTNKSQINAKNFSESLLAALKEAKLSEVILLTHSHGGLIGSYASKSDLVDRVISVHPPILGTPLANVEYIRQYKQLLTKTQKLLLAVINQIVDINYGFQRDNYEGADLRDVDLNKLLVVGDYLDPENDKNRIMRETYQIIEKVTGMHNEGVVIFEPSEFERQGINYLQTDERRNHFDSSDPDYFKRILSRVLNK